jgi:glycerol-3-phosphate dehydrogenase
MRRDASRLLEKTFDLLVVGAGIQGACIAWDACLRGLSVALVDRGDFGGATSANSLGIVHGGLRYLGRGDLPRMLESIRERSALLRIAPGLVEPLPVLIPTYRGAGGPAALRIALLANDLISLNRNRWLEPDQTIARGRILSRDECLRLFPSFHSAGLTGGALWYDGRLSHPERLTLSFVRSAAERGAVSVNYLRVDDLLVRDGAARGARVTDLDSGGQFEVGAHCVVVAAGPWTSGLIAGTLGRNDRVATGGRALAVNVRVGRVLSSVAIGAKARSGPGQDPVCGGGRYLFAVPQPTSTLLGTWYAPAQGGQATPELGGESLLQEFNAACPGLDLSVTEIVGRSWGWLPLKAGLEGGRPNALAERPRIVNHAERDRIRHLFSVEPVKYTTARSVAQQVVDRVFYDLRRGSPPCRTAEVRLEQAGTDGVPGPEAVRRAVQQDMALTLGDIIFRRTGTGQSGRLDRSTVAEIAQLAGAELGWDSMRQATEIEAVMQDRGASLRVEEPVG